MLDKSIVDSTVFWGEILNSEINRVKPTRDMLIEGILPSKSTIMVFADDGVGKSIVMQQALMQATSKSPVFGYYTVENNVKTIWLQCERPMDESTERMKCQRKKFPFHVENFILDTSIQGADLNEKEDVATILKRIDYLVAALPGGKVDVIVIDPIYALLEGDMVSNKDASKILSLSRNLQNRYECSILLIHHTNRGGRDEKGKRTGGDMFGSRYFSAQCTGTFHLKPKEGGVGTDLCRLKNSHKNLDKHIDLMWEDEFQMSYVNTNSHNMSKVGKVIHFIRTQGTLKQTFTFQDILDATQVSTTYLRGLVSGQLKSDLKLVDNPNGRANLYEYVGS